MLEPLYRNQKEFNVYYKWLQTHIQLTPDKHEELKVIEESTKALKLKYNKNWTQAKKLGKEPPHCLKFPTYTTYLQNNN